MAVQRNELHWGDILVILGYFVAVITVGIWVSTDLSGKVYYHCFCFVLLKCLKYFFTKMLRWLLYLQTIPGTFLYETLNIFRICKCSIYTSPE